MKHLFLLMLALFGLISCASQNYDQLKSSREPASLKTQEKEMLWGHTLTESESSFIEEIENSPAQSY